MIFSKQEERIQEGKSNDYHEGDFSAIFQNLAKGHQQGILWRHIEGPEKIISGPRRTSKTWQF